MTEKYLGKYHIGSKVDYFECPHCDGHRFQIKRKTVFFIFDKIYVSDEICRVCNGAGKVTDSVYHKYMKIAYYATDLGIYDYKYM